MHRDLNHSNQYIVGLALCALGNICSAEMARDLAPEVERLLNSRDPNIKKKVRLFLSFKLYTSYLEYHTKFLLSIILSC